MSMPSQPPAARIRFDSFELDMQTRELRKSGRPVKLQDQPGKLLVLLATHAGELVTRAEIEKALWPAGEFVEFEHAVNTAMRKVREALGDDLERPRFIETLPRKGYRFIAAVEGPTPESPAATAVTGPKHEVAGPAAAQKAAANLDDFSLSRRRAWLLFLLIQAGYLAMYCGVLARAAAVEDVLAQLPGATAAIVAAALLVLALCGIAVRLYLLSAVGLHHPAAGAKFRKLFPALFVLDALWSITPLLLVPWIGYGLALGAIAPLVYLPFSQRTLVRAIYRQPMA